MRNAKSKTGYKPEYAGLEDPTSSGSSSASAGSGADALERRSQMAVDSVSSSWADNTPACGLINLGWLMQKFAPETVFQSLRTFAIADSSAASRTDDGYKFADDFQETMVTACKDLHTECTRLGLAMTAASVNNLLVYLLREKKADSVTHYFFTEIGNRLRDELATRAFLSIIPQKLSFYNPTMPLFGGVVDVAFPKAKHDIAEAGNCYACARNTASVFHCMRAMEYGVHAVAASLGMPDPIDHQRAWGKILGQIKDKVDAQRKLNQPEWNVRIPKLENAIAFLYAVKNAWRDDTMHVAAKYDEQEAERILIATRTFIQELATFIDENGNFKVP